MVAHEESRGAGSVLEESTWGRRGDAREIDRAKRLTDKVLIVTCWAYFLRLKISLVFRDVPVHRLVFVNF